LCWDEIYPVSKTQAYYAVLRYEEPERRKDKVQELICQSFENLTCPQKSDPIIKLGSKEKKLWAKTNSQQSRS
jgi:hypothetical protein